MTAKRRPDGGGTGGRPAGAGKVRPGRERDTVGGATGPESPATWGTTGELDREPPPPWGVSGDSPMDEGSEPTAVPPGRRGERRARGDIDPRGFGPAGRHGFGPVEPTRTQAAGPGGAPDPAPARRPFPDDRADGDLPDNSIERQTGMHPEG